METKSIPELLRRSLESHMAESDLRDDEELRALLGKLSSLSSKVAEAKARVLAKRQLKQSENATTPLSDESQ